MGDPACHLSRTCLSCGRLIDDGNGSSAGEERCPHCGASEGPLVAQRVNTILYCRDWRAAADFYGSVLGLARTFSNDWFAEFEVAPGASVSIADAARTSIEPGGGKGITLSLRVSDLAAERARLADRGAAPGPVRRRFGSEVFDVWDPEGNRLEFWA